MLRYTYIACLVKLYMRACACVRAREGERELVYPSGYTWLDLRIGVLFPAGEKSLVNSFQLDPIVASCRIVTRSKAAGA